MAVLRRLTALVTMLVTLLLVLTESGFACSGESMAGMAGMAGSGSGQGTAVMAEMPGMPGMPAADPAPAPSQTDRQGTPDEPPCRLPWAPGGCRDMAPCAPAALVVASSAVAPAAPGLEALVAAPVTAPLSVDTPPEPPPPRA